MGWRFLNLRGMALRTCGQRGDETALDRAIAAFHAVLEVRTRNTAPMDWAMTKNTLDNVLLRQGQRGDKAALCV